MVFRGCAAPLWTAQERWADPLQDLPVVPWARDYPEMVHLWKSWDPSMRERVPCRASEGPYRACQVNRSRSLKGSQSGHTAQGVSRYGPQGLPRPYGPMARRLLTKRGAYRSLSLRHENTRSWRPPKGGGDRGKPVIEPPIDPMAQSVPR
jgi:hypothetical protein